MAFLEQSGLFEIKKVLLRMVAVKIYEELYICGILVSLEKSTYKLHLLQSDYKCQMWPHSIYRDTTNQLWSARFLV